MFLVDLNRNLGHIQSIYSKSIIEISPMLLIPLPFIFVAIILSIIYYQYFNPVSDKRNVWLYSFLALLAFQELIIGIRYGYNVDWIKIIQPITAASIGPLAYLAFKRPKISKKHLLHALPSLICLLLNVTNLNLVDFFLALANLAYAAALILLALKGSDALTWVEIGRQRFITTLLWVITCFLMISGLTDLSIAYDFSIGQGNNTHNIIGFMSIFGIILTATIIFYKSRSRHNVSINVQPNHTHEKHVFDRLTTLMNDEKLYLDADINLNRISRRLSLPTRDISRAVNSQAGKNLSQYINTLRIEEACKLLAETKIQITQIVFLSGFNTKSNFNREFTRITHCSPSEWRKNNKQVGVV